jgi:hypothetical protein
MSTIDLTGDRPVGPVPHHLRPIAVGVRAGVTALVANIVLYAIGIGLGALWLLHAPGAGTPVPVPMASVAMSSIVPVIVATSALVALRRSASAVRTLMWLGLGAGVLSAVVPLTMDGDPLARSLLALMHVVVGLSWFCAVRPTLR